MGKYRVDTTTQHGALGPQASAGVGYRDASVSALVFRPARRATSHASCETPRSLRRLLQGGLPFSLHTPARMALVSVALALRRGRQSGLSGPTTGPAHAFAWHPALRSSDFPLPTGSSDHPAPPYLPNPFIVYNRILSQGAAFVKTALFGSRHSTPNKVLGSKDSNLNPRIQSAMFYH